MADFHHEGWPPEEVICYNSTDLEAVPSVLGQRVLILLYSLTSILALLGNLTVIVVEMVGKDTAQNIRKYLINLAVSDIIIGCVCVPFTYTDYMLGQWIFPHWLCPMAQFVQLLSVFVTSLTLTIIGIERYLATIRPFSALHRWMECHTHIMLLSTWVFGAAYAYIPITNTYTRDFTFNNQTYYECSYDNEVSMFKRRLFMSSNMLLTFLLPLCVLILTYTAIMRKLLSDQRPRPQYRSTAPTSTTTLAVTTKTAPNSGRSNVGLSVAIPSAAPSPNGSMHHSTSNGLYSPDSSPKDAVDTVFPTSPVVATSKTAATKPQRKSFGTLPELRRSAPLNHRSKTIKMMFTVILLYGVCWFPIKVYQMLLDFNLISYCSRAQLHSLVTIYFVCHWIAMANSFVNPIIYSFMSRSFRNDFRKVSESFRRTFNIGDSRQNAGIGRRSDFYSTTANGMRIQSTATTATTASKSSNKTASTHV